MKNKKTKRINIRVTEDEFTEIRQRAKKFQSLTHFIMTSIQSFEDNTIQERMEERKKLTMYYSKADEILGHIGGNLNQAMKRVNEAAKISIPTQSLILNGLLPVISQCNDICLRLRKELYEVTSKSAKG